MAGFATVLAVILVSNVVVYDRLRVIEAATMWRVHTAAVLDALATVASAMVDQETGVRGYLISGDEKFWNPIAGVATTLPSQ